MKNILKSFNKNYTISYAFGGFGNECQQISNAITYCDMNKYNFYYYSKFFKNFELINNNNFHKFNKYKNHSRFYYFDNTLDSPNLDKPINIKNKNIYFNNMESNFKKYLFPNFKFYEDLKLDDSSIVIHVRGGDIFEKIDSKIYGNQKYIQNPINYYLEIINMFSKVYVVTNSSAQGNKSSENPVIKELRTIGKVEIISDSLENDFNFLLNAKNLASSGVGTFSLAAALMSPKLKNFYCSNLYLKHHLNPEMIKSAKVHKYYFSNYKQIGDLWNGTHEDYNLMLDQNVEVTNVKILNKN